MIQVNTKGATTKDFETLNLIVSLETKRRINKVIDAESFGITTACFIDGEFVLVSDYPLPKEMQYKLEKA